MSRLLSLVSFVFGLGACATMPITLEPMAAGRAVQASEFPLRVDGEPGGRVRFSEGHIDGRTARVALTVENRSGEPFHVAVPSSTPSELVARPGESKSMTLSFPLPTAPDEVAEIDVGWSIAIGPAAPVERTARFMTQRGRRLPLESPGPAGGSGINGPGPQAAAVQIRPGARVIF